jgi:copper chaperone CopZ
MNTLRSLVTAALLAALSLPAAARTVEMTVDGLVCAFCAQGIDKKLRKLDATEDVYVSLEKKIVALSLKPGQDIDDAVLKETLTEAGYTVRSVTRTDEPLDAVRARAAPRARRSTAACARACGPRRFPSLPVPARWSAARCRRCWCRSAPAPHWPGW